MTSVSLPKRRASLAALLAALLGTASLAHAQTITSSPLPSSSPPPLADGVKSLGTIPLSPGEEPSHPWVSDDDTASGSLNADRFAWGEAAANAYKAKDFAEARGLWRKAADGGDPDALYALGVMSERGEGGPQNLEEALGWYYAASKKGVHEASAKVTELTDRLQKQATAAAAAMERDEAARNKGAVVKPNPPKNAVNADPPTPSPTPPVTRQAVPTEAPAQPDSPPAPRSDAMPPDDTADTTVAAASPSPPPAAGTTNDVATVPSNVVRMPAAPGAAVDNSPSKIEQYRVAAATKPEAAFMLASKYADGRGVAKNDAEAVKWYRAAADKGYAPAENNLGFMYAEGRGVKRDDREAVKWYERAAQRDYPPAQTSLGMMYAQGRGVTKNDSEALALYSSAANQGFAPATANLAQAYAEGRGIPRDEKTAQFLLSAITEKPRTGSGIYIDPGP